MALEKLGFYVKLLKEDQPGGLGPALFREVFSMIVGLEMLISCVNTFEAHLAEAGSSLFLADSERFIPGGIFVYGAATARLYQAIMEDGEVPPELWLLTPDSLTLAEAARRLKERRFLLIGCSPDNVQLILLDKKASESQDQWHQETVERARKLLDDKSLSTGA